MWPGYKSLKQLLLVKKKCAWLISSYIHGWVSGSWVVGWLAGKAENNAYFSLTWLELEFELHNNVYHLCMKLNHIYFSIFTKYVWWDIRYKTKIMNLK